ncbi:hypothetical protein H2248_009817 [Termitomyces sp. 'cryptogamus']|nr:hypothetical protein H2248_009817 [Termitomyces sp. 'cryptogamus']
MLLPRHRHQINLRSRRISNQILLTKYCRLPTGTQHRLQPTPPTHQNQPKVILPQFSLLVQRLQFHRSRGFSCPFRSNVSLELASKDNMVYRRAGTERFGQYVALPEKAGIIELGGEEGGAWIALRPEWYNTKIVQIPSE